VAFWAFEFEVCKLSTAPGLLVLFYKVLKSIVLSQWTGPVMRALAPVRISTGETRQRETGIGFKGIERHNERISDFLGKGWDEVRMSCRMRTS
jgi:hypothetical protein